MTVRELLHLLLHPDHYTEKDGAILDLPVKFMSKDGELELLSVFHTKDGTVQIDLGEDYTEEELNAIL